MNLHLSWDLFILVFFAVVVAYSFIIGRNQTLKVILGTYAAILCADGFGNLFAKYFASSETFLRLINFLTGGGEDQAVTFFKVLILIILVVIISVKGLFQVDAEDERPVSMQLIILFVLAILSAGLLISAILVFVSGNSLIGGSLNNSNLLLEVYKQSRFVRIMIDYSNVWFFLPATAFISLSVLQKK